MIYQGTNPILEILDVAHLKWKGGTFSVPPRAFAAIAFRIKGTAKITAYGKEYHVSEGEVLYFPQNLSYTAQYSETEMIVFHVRTEKIDPYPEVYSPENADQIYHECFRAYNAWQNKNPGYIPFTMSRLYSVLGQICVQETTERVPDYFLHALSFIHSHYTDGKLSIESVCKSAGISATSLRLLFQKHVKKTPIRYITDLRLEYARGLISCGVPIEKAASESGFSDPKYFSRVVKKNLGCTPRELKTYGK